MKKMKQILAMTGVILLVGIYITTLVSAILSTPATASLFKASVFCTVAVPILLYAYMLIYKVLKQHGEKQRDANTIEKEDSIKKKSSE